MHHGRLAGTRLAGDEHVLAGSLAEPHMLHFLCPGRP